ncbi:MAG: FmdB family zinc ribbon protein [Arthrobacter sp.]|uniref:FmdB family zinc ribbon protein n=1 Tax=Arthrobacter sp. TaxID=1667 RepID=UPI0034701E1C
MPTYVYACKDCTHSFEIVQSFTDDSLSSCPECAGRLRKKFNSVGVVFKGSGFYRTDSRGGGSATAAAAPSSSESTSGSESTSPAKAGAPQGAASAAAPKSPVPATSGAGS